MSSRYEAQNSIAHKAKVATDIELGVNPRWAGFGVLQSWPQPAKRQARYEIGISLQTVSATESRMRLIGLESRVRDGRFPPSCVQQQRYRWIRRDTFGSTLLAWACEEQEL